MESCPQKYCLDKARVSKANVKEEANLIELNANRFDSDERNSLSDSIIDSSSSTSGEDNLS